MIIASMSDTLELTMTIKDQINSDIKIAMLAGDKDQVMVLRGLKSVILYAEVAEGARDSGLAEPQVVGLMQKELKKRQESADLYRQGGNIVKAEAEESEKIIIAGYLPEQLTEMAIKALIENEIKRLGDVSLQQMGQLIGSVKTAGGGNADGAVIARLVKERLT